MIGAIAMPGSGVAATRRPALELGCPRSLSTSGMFGVSTELARTPVTVNAKINQSGGALRSRSSDTISATVGPHLDVHRCNTGARHLSLQESATP